MAAGEYQSLRGALTVTAPLVMGRMYLLPIIDEFMATFIDVRLRCRFNDGVLDFADEHLDVAVRVGDLTDSRRRAQRVGVVTRVICASPDYIARCSEPRAPGDLTDHECVAFHGFDPQGSWLFSTNMGLVPVPIRSRVIFDTIESVVDAWIVGMGLVRVFSYHARPVIGIGKVAGGPARLLSARAARPSSARRGRHGAA